MISSRSLDAVWPHIGSAGVCWAIIAELQWPAASQQDSADADVFAEKENVFSRMPAAIVSDTTNCAINRTAWITEGNIGLGKLEGMARIIMHFDVELNRSESRSQMCSFGEGARSLGLANLKVNELQTLVSSK